MAGKSRRIIGVLALQGDVAEHLAMLHRVGADPVAVRAPGELAALDGLIIPGGESTTIAKLVMQSQLVEPLRLFARSRAVWGTCAGAVLLARRVYAGEPLLGSMDIAVRRNAFGSQAESFQTDLQVAALTPPQPYPGTFIRAPVIESTGPGVTVLATLADGRVVAVREGALLATSFHPELTGDARFHEFFLSLI